MKVTVINRSVYHKYAEVDIEVPNDVDDIHQWLIDNEHTYIYEMDESINESKYQFGSGVNDYDGMTEPISDSEWRYECIELKTGGHL